MAQPWQQQPQRHSGHGIGGGLPLLAALLMLLSLCCLTRLDAAAAATASAARTDLKDGVATALQQAAGQEAARGFRATRAEEEGPAVPVRVEMEVIEDYPSTRANGRHNPNPHP